MIGALLLFSIRKKFVQIKKKKKNFTHYNIEKSTRHLIVPLGKPITVVYQFMIHVPSTVDIHQSY